MTDPNYYSTADELRPGCVRLVWGIVYLGMAAFLIIALYALLEALH